MTDTIPEMKKLYHDLLMQKTGEERFLMEMSMCDVACRIELSSFLDYISETEKGLDFYTDTIHMISQTMNWRKLRNGFPIQEFIINR